MGNKKLNPDLQKKINQVLLKEWDPIGIGDDPQAQNEYNSYVFPVLDLLISENSEQNLFKFLWWVETDYMGLPGDESHTKAIVKRLISLIDE